MDVNWLKVSFGNISTTLRSGGSVVLGFLLSDVCGPVLSHRRAGDDVGHRTFDVLLDQSTESGVVNRRMVNGGFVLVGLSPRDDLRAKPRKTRGYRRKQKKTGPDIRNLKFQTSRGERQNTGRRYSPGRVGESGTDRVNPTLNRIA